MSNTSWLVVQVEQNERMFINHHLNDFNIDFPTKITWKYFLLQELNWPPLFKVCGGIFCDELPFTCFVVSQVLDHVCLDRDNFHEKNGQITNKILYIILYYKSIIILPYKSILILNHKTKYPRNILGPFGIDNLFSDPFILVTNLCLNIIEILSCLSKHI